MFDSALALRDGLILSVLASIVLIALLRTNPRLLMQDYPAPIQALAPPKTEREKRQGLVLGLPFLILLLAVPCGPPCACSGRRVAVAGGP